MSRTYSPKCLAALCVSLLVIGCKSTDSARVDDDDDDGEVEVTLEQCPPAVQSTIKNCVDNGTINEIEQTQSGNYEVGVTTTSGSFEFAVASDGTYLGQEVDDEDDDDVDDDD